MIPITEKATSVAVNIKKPLDLPFIVIKVKPIRSDLLTKLFEEATLYMLAF